MASSNRHWPSMFKTKPCNSIHQWQHEINSPSISNGCQRTPYSSGCEERSPEPKPRWNPRPEQIRILEAIFNSGMVNPPRDEIRKIRAQLQEYGQVGDANVFYWFQNRKSRSKHKQRHLIQNSKLKPPHQPPPPSIASSAAATIPSSSSSSSEKCSLTGSAHIFDSINSPTPSVNQPFLQNEFLTAVPFFLPLQPPPPATAVGFSQGFCFSDGANYASSPVNENNNCSSNFLLSDLLMMNSKKAETDYNDEKMKMQQVMNTTTASFTDQATIPPTTFVAFSNISHIQGESGGLMGPTKSTVFINDVAFEVTMGPFNVREAFGEDAVLIHSNGQTVVTNECGITLQPLQHGSFYYLIRTLSPSTLDTSIDLI